METKNLGEFERFELVMVRDLLSAMIEDGLPAKFGNHGVTIARCDCVGSVCLVNSASQIARMNGENLEIWHRLTHSGCEGFADFLWQQCASGRIPKEDWEQLSKIVDDADMVDEWCEINKKIERG